MSHQPAYFLVRIDGYSRRSFIVDIQLILPTSVHLSRGASMSLNPDPQSGDVLALTMFVRPSSSCRRTTSPQLSHKLSFKAAIGLVQRGCLGANEDGMDLFAQPFRAYRLLHTTGDWEVIKVISIARRSTWGASKYFNSVEVRLVGCFEPKTHLSGWCNLDDVLDGSG